MKNIIGIALSLILLSGCVSGLNSAQTTELEAIKNSNANVYVQQKDPTTAAILGILPIASQVYTEKYAYIVGDLLYPLSILWNIPNGNNAAKVKNYEATMAKVKSSKKKEIDSLEADFFAGKIKDQKDYLIKKSEIERKYNFN
jgi:hypothetical protein